MKKFLHTIFYYCLKLYWKTLSPKTFGVKGLIVREGETGKILLVRHSYGNTSRWNMCGGGYRPGSESPQRAVMREIQEELGVHARIATKLGSFTSTAEGKRDTVDIFLCVLDQDYRLSINPEISEIRWFMISEIDGGTDVSKVVRTALVQYGNYLAENSLRS